MSHSMISPSNLHRILQCPPSAKLALQYPNESSAAAQEGTLAHDYAARLLQWHYGDDCYRLNAGSVFTESCSAEMREACEFYLTKCREYEGTYRGYAVVGVERRLEIPFIEDAWGTVDFVAINPDGKELFVNDFKYGFNPVKAKNNPQIRAYAAAALAAYGDYAPIERVRLGITQPRVNPQYSEEVLTVEELNEWVLSIQEALRLAERGTGDFKAGSHCIYCPALVHCPERHRELYDSMMLADNPVHTLSPDEIAKILSLRKRVEQYLQAVTEYALAEALKGVEFPNCELELSNTKRKIEEPDMAIIKLRQAGFDIVDVAKPWTLKTLGELEKLAGKARLSDILGDLIVKPQGEPRLVYHEPGEV